MKLYHLSHTDLDGYSCQYISSKYFENGVYYNSNYGSEITFMATLILNKIAQNKEDALFLITDLNLNLEQCDFLNTSIHELSNQGIKVHLQLLDHHKSGAESAKNNNWYLLDNSRSATKITFDYFITNYGDKFSDAEKKYIASVNAADIWLEKDPNFEFGKVCMALISGAKEVNRMMFNFESSEFYIYLIEKAIKYINEENAHIKLDDAIHGIKKSFLQQDGGEDTLENLKSIYITNLLNTKKESLLVEYKGSIGILTFGLGSISVLANNFLKQNPDIEFFLDVTYKGGVSFRANNKVDVSQISKELFGGGGHANAAGGKWEEFKESFDYEDVKNQLEDYIRSKS